MNWRRFWHLLDQYADGVARGIGMVSGAWFALWLILRIW